MKASELMIGDWVQYDDGNLSFTTKIRGINEVEFEIGNINCTSTTLILCHYIKPIPITKEILKANGFGFMDTHRLVFVPDDGGFISYQTVTHCVSVGYDGSVKKNIGYVHELQHAFRLCGLTELADSFKIGGEE